jgi:hypothetical protein
MSCMGVPICPNPKGRRPDREVFRYMNRGKPTNVRCSITPKTGERLTDAHKSVNGLQTGITKAVIE